MKGGPKTGWREGYFTVSFFFLGTVFYHFFLAHPWPQVFFGEAPTYPNPPITLLPTTHLPPSSCWPPPHPPPFAFTSIARAFELERAWVAQSFKSTKSTRASRVGSFNVVATRAWKQEELQGGDRSGRLKQSSLSSSFLISCIFFVTKKMTTMSLLSSFVSSYCKKKDNNSVTVVVVFFSFFSFFLLQKNTIFSSITPLYLGWGNDGTSSINFPSCNSISSCSSKTYYCKIKARELYKQKSDQQHGLKSCHLFVLLWCKG